LVFFLFTQQLDNKSSPLALLAQTCSAIGADTTNPKLLAANIEKSTKQMQHQPKGSSGGGSGSGAYGLGQQTSMDGGGRDKSSPVSSHSSSVSTGSVEQQQLPMAHGSNNSGSISSKPTPTTFKPYEPNNNISNMTTAAVDCGATNLSSNNPSGQQRVKTPKSTANGGGQRCDSNQSASSHRESPTAAAGSLRRTPTSGMGGGGQLNGSPGLPPSSSGRSSSKESAAMHSPSAAAAAAAAAAQIASSNRLQEAALAAAKEASYVKALHAASQQGSAAAASYYPPGKCNQKLWEGVDSGSRRDIFKQIVLELKIFVLKNRVSTL